MAEKKTDAPETAASEEQIKAIMDAAGIAGAAGLPPVLENQREADQAQSAPPPAPEAAASLPPLVGDAAQTQPAVPMMEVQVYDAALDTWTFKRVPDTPEERQKADNALRGIVDCTEGAQFGTDAYRPDMTYYWGNKNSPSQMADLRAKRYAPVRESVSAQHPVVKVEGLGNVVCIGDAVLFSCPRAAAEARERNAIALSRELYDVTVNRPTDDFRAKYHRPGYVNIEGGYSQGEQQLHEMVAEDEYDNAQLAAQSLLERRAYDAQQEAGFGQTLATAGRKVFGGLSGPADKTGRPNVTPNSALGQMQNMAMRALANANAG